MKPTSEGLRRACLYQFNWGGQAFNATTVIKYQIPQDTYVVLKVYDILGKEVVQLVNEKKQAGYYQVTFDAGRLSSGLSAKGGYASGVYFYRMLARPISGGQAGSYISVKKMLMLK